MALLKVKEVAERLNVSHDTATRLVNSGELPSHRIGPKVIRVSEEDLNAFLEQKKMKK